MAWITCVCGDRYWPSVTSDRRLCARCAARVVNWEQAKFSPP